ncbi:kinase-like protein [Aspergillus carlsbadensis]|nr:kinase-like protein [Aspergillus carlsbadensis]
MPVPQPGQIIYVTKGHFLAWGGTAILERLLTGDVIKTPKPHPDFHDDHCRSMLAETEVYHRLGANPQVSTLINWDPDTCCLTMEYLEKGELTSYIQNHDQDITPELRLRWALQAAEGIAALYSIEVIHCDVSPRNFLLGRDLDLKIADFGGASISGSQPSAVAGTRFLHPQFDWSQPPQFGDDIFSLGSPIYFIMTGNYPYAEKASDEVEVLYASENLPDVSNLTCGSIISQCWARTVHASERGASHTRPRANYVPGTDDYASPYATGVFSTTLPLSQKAAQTLVAQ